MLKGIIMKSVPEKLCRSYIYSLIKGTETIHVADGKFHIKDEDGTWPVVSEEATKLRIRSMFADPEWQSVLDDGLMGNIIKSLKSDPDLQKPSTEFKHGLLLKARNGIWDIHFEILEEDLQQQFFTRAIDVVLTKEIPEESEVFVEFCEKVFADKFLEAKMQALYEIIGYSVSDIEVVKKAVLLIGPSNCGKSVVLKFIQKLVGVDYVSNISLSGLAQRFSIAEMYGKVININGEIPSGALPGRALDTFKSITGGDRIQMERKGSHPFSAVLDTKMLFAGNTLPVFNRVDGTDALIERLHILIFDKEVPEEERDPKLLDKLWEDRHTIVRHALRAVKDFAERGSIFSSLPDEESMLKSLGQVANPIVYFLDRCTRRGAGKAAHITDVYEAYRKFATNEALPDFDRTTFRNLMTTQPGVTIGKTKKRLGKKSPQICFEGIELINENEMNLCDNDQATEM